MVLNISGLVDGEQPTKRGAPSMAALHPDVDDGGGGETGGLWFSAAEASAPKNNQQRKRRGRGKRRGGAVRGFGSYCSGAQT